MINDHNTDNQVRVADWPFWKGTPLDLIMYAGYLYGRDILMGAPWIAYANLSGLAQAQDSPLR